MAIDAEFKRRVRKKLLALPHAKPSGRSEVILFCPFCRKDTDHGHFYVAVDEHSDLPLVYHCFRCEASGVLNGEVMRGLGVRELSLNSEIIRYNKKSVRKYGKSINLKTNQIDLKIPLGTEKDLMKKRYIESRLGISFTFEELQELKCIFSLKRFLIENKIERITCRNETAFELERDYVGFVTVKNEFISFRDTTNKHKKRYNKYDIFGGEYQNTRKFYTIPNTIDYLTTEDINIVLAEGYFDILGVYKHVFNGRKKNMIYAAILGCGFETVIKYFIQLGFIGSNIHLHIFSDKDKSPAFYTKALDNSSVADFICDTRIYYNAMEGEKDFGVPKDRIILTSKKIR